MAGPGYTIDDHTLRERVDDPVAARAWVGELAEQGPGADGERVSWLRMLGRLEEAERLGWHSLAAAGGPGSAARLAAPAVPPVPWPAVGAALRLAHVLQWQRRFELADALFQAAQRSADAAARSARPGSPEHRSAQLMRAFARQHVGKSRYDQGRYDEALGLFTQALALRLSLGAPAGQLASSRQAVLAAGQRLTARGVHLE